LQPGYPEAHCNLGHTLRDQGQFAEALEELRRGHESGSKAPGWPYPSAAWVRQCERLAELDRQLPAILAGDARPASAAEGLEFAFLCQHRARCMHAAAARLAAAALAADPKLVNEVRVQHRYNAARSAARAAAGQAEDAKMLPDKARLMLRRQAQAWLRDDLAVYRQLAGAEGARPAVRQRLAQWQQDADLASVRDPQALDRLPDDEREGWRKFWQDVAALLKKVQEKK
jgi:hypothetical protein